MSSESRARMRLTRGDPLVKTIRALKRSADERIRLAMMIVEGVRLAEEALAERVDISAAVIGPRLESDPRGRLLAAGLRRAGIEVRQADEALLRSLHDTESHQGILLLAPRPSFDLIEFTAPARRASLLLVACGVQDPGNMGALVRLADAAGADGLLAMGGADPFGPKAVRASAGSIFRLAVARTPSIEATALGVLRSAGIRIAGAVVRGGRDYRRSDLSTPVALVLGGEGAGLPPEILEEIDLAVTIPINPRVESINVAAAAALLLFEATRGVNPGEARQPDSARPGRRSRAPRRGPSGR